MSVVVQGHELPAHAVAELLEASGAGVAVELAPGACRLVGGVLSDELRAYCAHARLDCTKAHEDRTLDTFGLFVTDMDSTLINIECIDEVADMQGAKAAVAEITEAAMRGEIDFVESLTRRVRLLAGLPESALEQVFEQRLQLNPGAARLLERLQNAGIYTVLVSGGFTYFSERLKTRLGFDEAFANALEIQDGHLTGHLLGPILDGNAKAAHLRRIRDRLGLRRDQVIAVGDGANDVAMLREAGYAVAYRAKPVLRAVADCDLDHAGLDGILHVFA